MKIPYVPSFCQTCGTRFFNDVREGGDPVVGADLLKEHRKTCAPKLLKTRREVRALTGCGCCGGDPEGILQHDQALRELLMHVLLEHPDETEVGCEQCDEAMEIARATGAESDKLTEEW